MIFTGDQLAKIVKSELLKEMNIFTAIHRKFLNLSALYNYLNFP